MVCIADALRDSTLSSPYVEARYAEPVRRHRG